MYQLEDELKLHTLCEENPELKELLKEYENENKFLLSRMTHELRNPLTLIYSTLQLIQSKNKDLEQIPHWSSILDDMKDVFALLDQLSDYNHCDALHKSDVDLVELLTELKISFDSIAAQKHSSITIKLEKNAHDTFKNYYCDAIKLKQVFTNLIKNALEAISPSGHIQILLTPNEMLEDSSYLKVSISNDGDPIPDEELEHIFEPFVTTKSTGTGLGLPTANRIIQSHGGLLQVTSSKKETVFSIYLPTEQTKEPSSL